FCDRKPLSGSAQAALDILREAAQPPAYVLDTAAVTLDTLLNDASSADTNGSVRERLTDRWQVNFGGVKIEEYYRLTAADFEAARDYRIQDIKAFSRSMTE